MEEKETPDVHEKEKGDVGNKTKGEYSRKNKQVALRGSQPSLGQTVPEDSPVCFQGKETGGKSGLKNPSRKGRGS